MAWRDWLKEPESSTWIYATVAVLVVVIVIALGLAFNLW